MAQHDDIGKIRDEIKADFSDLTPIIYNDLALSHQTISTLENNLFQVLSDNKLVFPNKD